MKKLIFLALMCAFFIIMPQSQSVYAESEQIELTYQNKTYIYNIYDNRDCDSLFYTKSSLKYYDVSTRKDLVQRLKKMDIPNEYIVQYLFPNIDKTIGKISKNIRIKEKNAYVSTNTNTDKVFTIHPEIIGRELDTPKLYSEIIDNIINDKPISIELKSVELKPTVLAKDLRKSLYLRSDFSTNISSSSKERKHNIKNAMNSINKTKIQPNEVFSFNSTVGKRTAENGYMTAKIIVNNEFVDGIGGGVCQVSSTLYNACLLAGLEILESHPHSRPVGYVKSGFDAMVNFGTSDLKIRNNTNSEITIITNYTNDTIRIRIFGADLFNRIYKTKSEILKNLPASEKILIDTEGKYIDRVMYDDEFFYEKKASDGKTISSTRCLYENGILISEEKLRTDTIKPQDAVKIYGSLKRTMVSD